MESFGEANILQNARKVTKMRLERAVLDICNDVCDPFNIGISFAQ